MIPSERVTRVRLVIVTVVLALAVAPVVPLLLATGAEATKAALWTRSFLIALITSLAVGAGVTLLSFSIGFPLGLVSALYRFPGRGFLLLTQALPLLLPSFLLAIGWSNLVTLHRLPHSLAPAGVAGVLYVLGMQAVPLPYFATLAACRNLTATQLDAARLHGGERAVLRLSARACAAPAILAALLAGLLSLSDTGAPLILGAHVVAVEILTSFSALYDFGLAARQCLTLAALVLMLAAPILWLGVPSLAAAVLARQTRAGDAYPHRTLGYAAILGLAAVLAFGLGLPVLGLCLPMVSNSMLGQAAREVQRTLANTVVYSGSAGLVAVAFATCLALAVGKQWRLRLTVLGTLLGLFALPPALAALGVMHMAAQAPPVLDWLTRGRAGVALVLGLRFLPIATLAMMRGVGSLSPSWVNAARLHGVSPSLFLGRVVLPLLRPSLLASLVLVMVLATADITTVLLLQPPGRASLPVAIFTVMANSPEGLVASLCLLYVAGVSVVMAGVAQLSRVWAGRAA